MLGVADYLWRLIPGNPILRRVVETGGKKRRDLFIRCGYLGLLIGVVVFSLLSSTSNFSGMSLDQLAKESAQLFRTASYWQLGLVAFLAPVFTAGAITQEKDSQTYDILLATPLTNAQIVLGSLLSRLFFVVTLLVSGIPVFSITQIFGGVAIQSIAYSFAIAAATAFVTGAVAMAIAVFKVGTRRTIFSFYLFITIYVIGTLLLDRREAFHPILEYGEQKVVLSEDDKAKLNQPDKVDNLGSVSYVTKRFASKGELTGVDTANGYNGIATTVTRTKTSWLTGINPFLALRSIFNEKEYIPPDFNTLQDVGGQQSATVRRDAKPLLRSWPWRWYFTGPAGFYISLMFTASLVLAVPSIGLLRRLAQSTNSLRSWVLQKLRISKGDKSQKPRAVWSNPIAWREAKTKASAARAMLLRYTFMIAGLGGAISAVVLSNVVIEPSESVNLPESDPGTLSVIGNNDPPRPVPPGTVYKVLDDAGREKRYGAKGDVPPGRYRLVSFDTDRSDGTGGVRTDGGGLTTVSLAPFEHRLSASDARNWLLGMIAIEFAVILLIVTNASASTVTREKEDGSLDLLLATPITSRYYIWGKLRGLVSFVLPLSAIPLISIALFVVSDLVGSARGRADAEWVVFPEALLVLPGTLTIVVAFAAILGMQMSLRCRRTVMAVMSSVGIVMGICVGLGLCGYKAVDRNTMGPVGLVFGSFSPFTLVTLLIDPRQFAREQFGFETGGAATSAASADGIRGARIMVFVFGWIATGAYTLVVWGMYKSMVTNFDMTIRKQSR